MDMLFRDPRVDLDMRDDAGKTALDIAIEAENTTAIEILSDVLAKRAAKSSKEDSTVEQGFS